MSTLEVLSHVTRLTTTHDITPSKVGSLKQPMYREQIAVNGSQHQLTIMVREYGRVGGKGPLVITDVDILTYPTDSKVTTSKFTIEDGNVKEVYAMQHGWELVEEVLTVAQ